MSEASGAISGDDEEDEAAMEQELRRRMQESICSASGREIQLRNRHEGFYFSSPKHLGDEAFCYLHLRNEATGNELCAMPIKR